jgi:YtfJ family uncharacterized protein
MKKVLFSLGLIVSTAFALNIGEVPNSVTIDAKNGGKISGGAWDSSMLKDKIHVVFYVDPDEKDKNEKFADALKAEKFDHSKYGTVAIVNLAATWKPDVIIEALLKSKQKKFPHAIYVKDKKKVLVKEWGLADDNSDIMVFGKDGKLLYLKEGKLDKQEIEKVIEIIRSKI